MTKPSGNAAWASLSRALSLSSRSLTRLCRCHVLIDITYHLPHNSNSLGQSSTFSTLLPPSSQIKGMSPGSQSLDHRDIRSHKLISEPRSIALDGVFSPEVTASEVPSFLKNGFRLSQNAGTDSDDDVPPPPPQMQVPNIPLVSSQLSKVAQKARDRLGSSPATPPSSVHRPDDAEPPPPPPQMLNNPLVSSQLSKVAQKARDRLGSSPATPPVAVQEREVDRKHVSQPPPSPSLLGRLGSTAPPPQGDKKPLPLPSREAAVDFNAPPPPIESRSEPLAARELSRHTSQPASKEPAHNSSSLRRGSTMISPPRTHETDNHSQNHDSRGKPPSSMTSRNVADLTYNSSTAHSNVGSITSPPPPEAKQRELSPPPPVETPSAPPVRMRSKSPHKSVVLGRTLPPPPEAKQRSALDSWDFVRASGGGVTAPADPSVSSLMSISSADPKASPSAAQVPLAPGRRQIAAPSPPSALDDWNFVLGNGSSANSSAKVAPRPRLPGVSEAADDMSLMSLSDADARSLVSSASVVPKVQAAAAVKVANVPLAPGKRQSVMQRSQYQ
jgi:hypothetical protein